MLGTRGAESPFRARGSPYAGGRMQNPANELPRTPLLGRWVHKGKEAGPELLRPGPAACFLLILALGLAARTR